MMNDSYKTDTFPAFFFFVKSVFIYDLQKPM